MFALPVEPSKTLQDNLGNEISDIAAFVLPKPHNCSTTKKSKAQHFSTYFSQNLQLAKLFLKRNSIRVDFEERNFAFLYLEPVDSVWWFSELAKY